LRRRLCPPGQLTDRRSAALHRLSSHLRLLTARGDSRRAAVSEAAALFATRRWRRRNQARISRSHLAQISTASRPNLDSSPARISTAHGPSCPPPHLRSRRQPPAVRRAAAAPKGAGASLACAGGAEAAATSALRPSESPRRVIHVYVIHIYVIHTYVAAGGPKGDRSIRHEQHPVCGRLLEAGGGGERGVDAPGRGSRAVGYGCVESGPSFRPPRRQCNAGALTGNGLMHRSALRTAQSPAPPPSPPPPPRPVLRWRREGGGGRRRGGEVCRRVLQPASSPPSHWGVVCVCVCGWCVC